MDWQPRSAFTSVIIDRELRRLASLDVPLFHLEAVLLYSPERFDSAENGKTLRGLVAAGCLDEATLHRWRDHTVNPGAHKLIDAALADVGMNPRKRVSRRGQICCPVVVDHKPIFRPGATLSGIKWIEVTTRAQGAGVAAGFTQDWSDRLEALGAQVRDALQRTTDGRRPHWTLLNSLRTSVANPESIAGRSSSLELGAALAYARWLLSLELTFVVAATGKVSPGGRIEPVEEISAKAAAIVRAAPSVEFLALPDDPPARLGAAEHPLKCSVLHAADLATVLRWMLRLARDHSPSEAAAPAGRFGRTLLACVAAGLGLGAAAVLGAQGSLNHHRTRRPAECDEPRRLDDAGAAAAHDGDTRLRDGAAAGDTPPVLVSVDASGKASLDTQAQPPSPALPDAATPRCAYEGPNHVCMARLVSRLFGGAWPPAAIEPVRWFGTSDPGGVTASVQVLGTTRRRPVLDRDDAGVSHLQIDPPPEPGPQDLYDGYGSFSFCLEDASVGYAFCGGTNTTLDPARDAARADRAEPGEGWRGPPFILLPRTPPGEIVDAQMGVEVVRRPGIGDGRAGTEFVVSWSSRGIRGPLSLFLETAGAHRLQVFADLADYGEGVVSVPNVVQGERAMLICLYTLDRRFKFCRRLPVG